MKLSDHRQFIKQSLPEKSSSDIVSSFMCNKEAELEEAPILGRTSIVSNLQSKEHSFIASEEGMNEIKKDGDCSGGGPSEIDSCAGNCDGISRRAVVMETSSGDGDADVGESSQGSRSDDCSSSCVNMAGEKLSGNQEGARGAGLVECESSVPGLSIARPSPLDGEVSCEARSTLVETLKDSVDILSNGNDGTAKNLARKEPKKNSVLDFDSPSVTSSPSGCEDISIAFDLEAVSSRLKALATGSVPSEPSGRLQEGLRFREKINPSCNAAAEDELQREIKYGLISLLCILFVEFYIPLYARVVAIVYKLLHDLQVSHGVCACCTVEFKSFLVKLSLIAQPCFINPPCVVLYRKSDFLRMKIIGQVGRATKLKKKKVFW